MDKGQAINVPDNIRKVNSASDLWNLHMISRILSWKGAMAEKEIIAD